MILKLLREGLGRVIVLASYLSLPAAKARSPDELRQVAEQCLSLSLYQFYACPFCVKTRRAVHRLNIPMQYRNVQEANYRAQLLSGGGRVKVPCLRIEDGDDVTWLYESNDIIDYLDKRFG